MLLSFTQVKHRKYLFVVFFLLFSIITVHAQITDSTSTVVDSATNKPAVAKPPKQKEIKKLDDPLLALSSDLMYRLKKMTPNQLLVIDERSVRNEKRMDDAGQEYEVTITVRLGFSQDMITGIVREVPLYQSNDREPYLLYVKIPVKFCCTTPIDTLHTKKHCGKMSELNDLEDNQHCKDWAQQDEAAEAAANTAGFGKPGGSKTSKKKSGDVTGKTTATDEEGEGFGKPIPKGKKPTKKGKNVKGQVMEDEEATTTDSTKAASTADSSNIKAKKEKVEKKKDTDEEGFGKPQPKSKGKKKGKSEVVKEEADGGEASTDSTNTKENSKPIDKKEKKEKTEKVEPKKDNDEEGFGKPQPKSKGKKKGKSEVEKDEPTETDGKEVDASVPSTDSTALPNKEPVKPSSKKDKKKKG